MKASMQWLRELTGIDASVDEVAQKLTAAGLEVEAIEHFDAPAAVVVGEVRSKEKHPDKDRLSIVRVFDGVREETVICGAPNVPGPGGRVLFARVGATLQLEDGTMLDIAERTIAGIASRGMICSESELRIGSGGDGIFVFDAQSPAPGTPLAEALPVGDQVLDIGLTPNRPDCLGHFGIARDLCALYGKSFVPPAVATPAHVARGLTVIAPSQTCVLPIDGGDADDSMEPGSFEGLGSFSVTLEDAHRCPRYAAAFVLNVTVGPSPFWVRYRLHVLGLRSRSNLVDATNYVMLATGHPLHGFDLESLRDRAIHVRCARNGERMKTLDDVERTLTGDDLLICDGQGPIAIAGVMGGEDSEIGESTRHVAIECAYFDPRSVRRTARRLGLHTDASHRFERGVDPNDALEVVARTAHLMAELGGGVALAEAIDVYPQPIARPTIRFELGRVQAVLGFEVAANRVRQVLTWLGCEVTSTGDAFEVAVPTWRPDLRREEDLIEEVIRIHGYEHVPSVVPPIRPSATGSPWASTFERRLKEAAAHVGLFEAINHAFVSPDDLKRARVPMTMVRLVNPLSEERSVMRTSLLPGLAASASHGLRRQASGVALFEVGRTFTPADGDLPTEHDRLGIFLAGHAQGPAAHRWIGGERPYDFYDLKGMVESVLAVLDADAKLEIMEAAPEWAHPRRCASLLVEREALGTVAELHPEVSDALGLEGSRGFYAEVDLGRLRQHVSASAARLAPALSRLPAVVRDVALVVESTHPAQCVADALREGGGELVESVTLFDLYQGDGVPPGKRSLGFRVVYRDPDQTLTDKRVDRAHRAAAESASRLYGAVVRG